MRAILECAILINYSVKTKKGKTMTRKHFTIVAKELNWSFRNAPNSAPIIRDLATALAKEFEQVNPNFNRSKFLAVALG